MQRCVRDAAVRPRPSAADDLHRQAIVSNKFACAAAIMRRLVARDGGDGGRGCGGGRGGGGQWVFQI